MKPVQKIALSLITLSLTMAAQPSFAGTLTRQHHQNERIAAGVADGSLTKREAHSLRSEQRSIREERRAYMADGKLDHAERVDLRQDQNQASRDIYNKRHNDIGNVASADPIRDPGVNQRQFNQRARIAQGVRSGELTRDEAQALRQEQRSIRAEERSYKSDGVLTRQERRDLHQDLNEANRDIYAQKHDAETR